MSSEPTEECENCLKSIPESKMPTHLSYCRRNIKKCPTCSLLYDINEIAEHEDEYHRRQACNICGIQLFKNELEEHKKTCKQKESRCLYCQNVVPDCLFQSHVVMCESKTKQCEKCGKNVLNKYYWEHTETCQGKIQIQNHPQRQLYGNNSQNPISIDSDEERQPKIPKLNSEAATIMNRLTKKRPVRQEKKYEFRNNKKSQVSQGEKEKKEEEMKGENGKQTWKREEVVEQKFIDVEEKNDKQTQKGVSKRRRGERKQVENEKRKRVKKGE